jgi:hypothetical protein
MVDVRPVASCRQTRIPSLHRERTRAVVLEEIDVERTVPHPQVRVTIAFDIAEGETPRAVHRRDGREVDGAACCRGAGGHLGHEGGGRETHAAVVLEQLHHRIASVQAAGHDVGVTIAVHVRGGDAPNVRGPDIRNQHSGVVTHTADEIGGFLESAVAVPEECTDVPVVHRDRQRTSPDRHRAHGTTGARSVGPPHDVEVPVAIHISGSEGPRIECGLLPSEARGGGSRRHESAVAVSLREEDAPVDATGDDVCLTVPVEIPCCHTVRAVVGAEVAYGRGDGEERVIRIGRLGREHRQQGQRHHYQKR